MIDYINIKSFKIGNAIIKLFLMCPTETFDYAKVVDQNVSHLKAI